MLSDWSQELFVIYEDNYRRMRSGWSNPGLPVV
jgi:hypothetical protein